MHGSMMLPSSTGFSFPPKSKNESGGFLNLSTCYGALALHEITFDDRFVIERIAKTMSSSMVSKTLSFYRFSTIMRARCFFFHNENDDP